MHKLAANDIGHTDNKHIYLEAPLNVAASRKSAKLVIGRPPEVKLDRAKTTAMARGTSWFEELTSGRAQSIRHIAEREGVTERYISRLIEQRCCFQPII
jgi:hypothetical protein